MVNELDLKAKLRMGSDIDVCGITIKNYKLGEIFNDIGITKYLQMTGLISRSPSDFIDKKYLKEISSVTMFDIFCMSYEMQELFMETMKFFTGYEWRFVANRAFVEFQATNTSDKDVHINKENHEHILNTIKEMYCLSEVKKESEREDIDDRMKEILAEFEEEENKVNKAKGGKITIFSIIDGVSTKHPSINILNIWNLTMFQLMRNFYSLGKNINEDRVMNGIYSGVIDSKKIDLDKIHWATES